MTEAKAALDELLGLASSNVGISAGALKIRLDNLFNMSRSKAELDDYRLSRGDWKKLADEVVPVSRLFWALSGENHRLRFPLNDEPPDCWIDSGNGSEPVGLEVTIAKGRERHELAKELVQTGVGRGFIDLPENASNAEYMASATRQRIMYSSDQAVAAVKDSILTSFAKKDRPQYDGMTLLVQAPLNSIPHERWTTMFEELKVDAQKLPFREVHVIGTRDSNGLHYRLK